MEKVKIRVVDAIGKKLMKTLRVGLAFFIALVSFNISSLFAGNSLVNDVEAAEKSQSDFWGDTDFLVDIDWNNLPGSVSYLEPIGDFPAGDVGQRSVVKFTQVSNGQMGAMALDANGAVWTWGYNLYGELGIGKTVTEQNYNGGMRRVDHFVNQGIFITQIQGNYQNRMALSSDGDVYTWGHGAYGQMGNGTVTGANNTPEKVPGLPKIEKIISSSGEIMGFNYAIDVDGKIWGWGYNSFGALGIGSVATSVSTPQRINTPAGIEFQIMGAGDHQFHAVDQNGDIWNAGYQYQGRLGNGQTAGYNATLTKMSKPVGMGKVVDISSCYGVTLALDENNKVWQWGNVPNGVSNTSTGSISRPVQVEIEQSEIALVKYTPVAQKVFAGEKVSYFVDQHGRSWAWGGGVYHGFGREGGKNNALQMKNTKAQQWPKVIGDGDTQEYDYSAKTPFSGRAKNWMFGFGSPDPMHPTIYDDKYMGNAKDDVWKELAFKNIPNIEQIISARSTYTLLDKAGNIYKWGYDGSGSVAWGWDYNSKYDNTGNAKAGLYDKYTYEVMFMRGAPTIDPMDMSIKKSTTKIYQDLDNPQNTPSDKIDVSVKIPAMYTDDQLNLTIKPELQGMKYVVIPYDAANPDFNLAESDIDEATFSRLYNDANYKNGSLIDETIYAETNEKTVKETIEVTENSRVIVMITDKAYGRVLNTVKAYIADNFYTPVDMKHEGNGYVDGSVYENIYAATAENVVNKDSDDKIIPIAGIPLDVNGEVINNPSFGYDKVEISKYGTLPNGEDKYWLFQTPQDAKKNLTLDDKKYVELDDGYVHEFKYERNPSGWKTISYEGRDADTNVSLAAFDMTPNPEIVKVDKELVRTPTQISNYEILGYKINTDTTIYDLDPSGDFIYTPTDDTHVTFLYGTWKSEGEKLIADYNSDGYASPGEELTYTLEYENTGSGSFNDLLVRDELANVLPYVLDPLTSTVTINNNGTITTKTVQDLVDGFKIGKVAGKAKVTVSFKVTLRKDLDVSVVTEIKNTAILGDVTVNKSIPTGEANLTDADKEAKDANNDGIASPGEELTYTIKAKNSGPAIATNFIVRDELKAVLPHVKNPRANVVEVSVGGVKTLHTVQDLIDGITIPEIKVGEEISVVFKVEVNADIDVEAVKEIANIAVIGDTEIPEVIPTGEAKLNSNKLVQDASGDGIASPGERLTYTIVSENEGPATASNLFIQDELATVLPHVKDPLANIVIVDVAGVSKSHTIQDLIDGIVIPTLLKDQTVSVTFDVVVKDNLDVAVVTKIANKATVGKTTPEKEIPTGKSELISDKEVVDASKDGIASPGEVLSYKITAKNNGTAVSEELTIKDTLSTVLPHIDETAGNIIVTINSDKDVSRNITVSGTELIAGLNYKLGIKETVTITFDVTVKSDLDVNTVTKIANQALIGDQTPGKEIPTGKESLEDMDKEVVDMNKDGIASPGEELKYTISTINKGTVVAKNVVIKDELTDVLPHVNDPKGNSVTVNVGGTITTYTVQDLIDGITILEIGVGNTATVSFSVVVKSDLDVETVKEIANKAVIDGEDVPEVIPTGKAELDSIKLIKDASGDGIASPGEKLTYIITSTNKGPATATDLLVQDKLTTVLPHVNNPLTNVVTLDVAGVKTNYTVQDLIDGITLPTVLKGQSISVTFDVVVKDDLDVSAVTKIANKATVGETTPEKEIPTGKSDLSDLDKDVKDANKDGIASPDEELTYTISATNKGTVVAKNVIVQDELTTVLPHVDSPFVREVTITIGSKITKHSVQNLIDGITIPEIGVGESARITFSVIVKADLDVEAVKEIANKAVIGGEEIPEVIPTGKAELDSIKLIKDASGDGIASPGEKLTYIITSTNKGPATATDLLVQDKLTTVLPHVNNPLTNVVTLDVAGVKTNYTVQDLIDGITLPTVLKGQSISVTFDVVVKDDLDVSAVTKIANKATVGETTPEKEIPTGKSDLSDLDKDVKDANKDGIASPDEELTYTISATNKGTVVAKNVIVQDELTTVLPHVDSPFVREVTITIGSKITKHSVQNLIDGITIPEIGVGESARITFSVIVKADLDVEAVKEIANKAVIGGEEIPEVIPTGKAELDSIKLIKDASGDGIASPGEKLTYIITSTNKGPATATDLLVQDKLTTVLPHVNNPLTNVVTLDVAGVKTNYTVQDLIDGITLPTVLKGQSISVTFDVVVKDDLDVSAVTKIANKATVGETTPEKEIPTGKSDLSDLDKDVKDANKDGIASPDEELTYTISATNKGTVVAKNVIVQDELTTVLPHVDSPFVREVTITIGSKITKHSVQNLIDGITIPEIGVGESARITFSVIVKADLDVEAVKEIANKAVIGGEEIPEVIPTGKAELDSIKLIKDASGDGIASPGEKLTYIITSTNKGPATATDLLVQDKLTTVLPHVNNPLTNVVTLDVAGVKTNYTVQDLIDGITLPTVLKGQSISVTFDVVVKDDLDVSAVTKIANKATVGETTPEKEIPTGKTDLSDLDKDVKDANKDGIASPDEELTYTISATNKGTVVAKNVVIKDELTDVLPHVNDPKGNSVTVNVGGTITTYTVQDLIDGITIPEIGVGKTVSVSFIVKVKADLDVEAVKEIANKAVIGGEEIPEVIPTGEADLNSAKIVKDASGDGIASPGEKLTYTIATTNNGPATASNLFIQDKLTTVLPHVNNPLANVVTLDVAGVKTTYTVQNLIDGITIPTVLKDQSVSVTFDVVVKDNLDVTTVTKIANKATVGKTTPEKEIPTGKTDLITDKDVVDASKDGIASPGEVLSYKITAKNNGTAVSEELTIKDTLSTVLPHIDETAGNIIVTINSDKDVSRNITVSGTELAAGLKYKLASQETITITFDVTVKSDLDVSVVKKIANQALIGDQTPGKEIPTGKTDLSDLDKDVKDANKDGIASPDEELTYTISATNKGTVVAKNVVIKDELTDVLPHVNDPKGNSVTVNVGGTITTYTVQDLIDGITIPEIGVGKTVSVSFIVKVKADLDVEAVKEIANKAVIGGEEIPEVIPTGKTDLITDKDVVDASKDGIASPGEVLSYKITAKNNGTAVSEELTIKDTLSTVLPHIDETAGNIIVTINSDKDVSRNITVSGTELAAGLKYKLASQETITITFDVTVKSDLDVSVVKKIANQALIGDQTPGKEIPTGTSSISSSKKVTDANKDGFASPREVLNYKITAKNEGTVTSNNVLLQDTLSTVLPHIDETAGNIIVTINSDKDVSRNITVSGTELAAGLKYKLAAQETITITFDVTVKSDLDVNAVTEIMNKAVIDGKEVPEVIPTGKTDLIANKDVVDASKDGIASPGENLTYTISARNDGNVEAKDVVIQDKLEQVLPHITQTKDVISVEITSSVDTGKNTVVSGNELISGLVYNLAPNEVVNVKFVVTVKAELDVQAVPAIANQALIGGSTRTATIPTGKVDLIANKGVTDASGDGIASPGEVLKYELSATNKGVVVAKNIVIQDTLDTVLGDIDEAANVIEVRIVSNKVSSKNVKISGEQLKNGITYDIEPGETIKVSFNVTVKSDLDVSVVKNIANTALIGEDSRMATIPTGDADLISMKKVVDEDGDGFASAGERLSYSILAKNQGSVKLDQIQVQDLMSELLPNIDGIAADIVVNVTSDKDASKNTVISGEDLVSGVKFDLEPQESITITFDVVLKASLNGDVTPSITNRAVVGDKTPEETIEVKKFAYQILYHANGYTAGAVPEDASVYYRNDVVKIKGILVRSLTTQTFVEWNTAADGSGVSFQVGDVTTFEALENLGIVAGDRSVTLYAIWKEEIPPIIVSPSITIEPSGPRTGEMVGNNILLIVGASIMSLLAWKKFKTKKSARRNRRV